MIKAPLFEKAYNELNEAQKEAVNMIYGPVMVIAGPGTGKTQLLALRVCNILLQTDMNASNILCLTFTNAGAAAMRNRLITMMGPEAYHVNVHTYHSFCNMVIRENPEEFSDFRELNNISELEVLDIMIQLLDEMPLDHPLKRLKGEIYYDKTRMYNLFQDMKKEGWTPEYIESVYQQYEASLLENEKFQYKQKSRLGEVNYKEVEKEMNKYNNILQASPLIHKYNELLLKRERIDFNDSINYVIKAFRDNPDLLVSYQERFQFVLADEYQDTNGTQNEILFLLNNYDDQPNLFVVGDDDQAIFRFQGANMNNIIDFKNKYLPKEVVLQQNYRSGQPILDAAMKLIDFNKERLGARFAHLSKNLTEARKNHNENSGVQVICYDTKEAQNIGIIEAIYDLVKETNTSYSDIAVIYKKNYEVSDLVKVCTYKGIPLNVKRKINVLDQIEAKRILLILKYLDLEFKFPHSAEVPLFEILHYDFWKIPSIDIARLAVYCSKNTDETEDDRYWRQVILSRPNLEAAGVIAIEEVLNAGTIIESWISNQKQVTIQVLFEKILTESGMLMAILNDEDSTLKLQVVNSLFDFIKEQTVLDPKAELSTIIYTLGRMQENNIALPIHQVISSKDGINFVTAHSSKGLEYKYVFIINASQEDWMKTGGSQNSYKYLPNLSMTSGDHSEEDERRLFYVALTRAQENAYISYARVNQSENENTPVSYISEMGLYEAIHVKVISNNQVDDYLATLLKFQKGKIELIDHDLVDRVIENLSMNATGVTKYLRCKTSYYFENILRVPMARTADMGFGNAMHYALEKFIINMNKDPKRMLPPVETLLWYFEKGMEKYESHFTETEYKNAEFNGNQTLPLIYEAKKDIWRTTRDIKTEYRIKTEYEGIPISGIIDRIDIYDDHESIADYKTGKNKSEKMARPGKNKLAIDGGDYWRQLIFYKMLLDKDPNHLWKLRQASIEYISMDDQSVRSFSGDDFEVDVVFEQLKVSYQGIKNHDFSPGCQDPKCKWCNFVSENMQLQSPLVHEDDKDTYDIEEYSMGD